MSMDLYLGWPGDETDEQIEEAFRKPPNTDWQADVWEFNEAIGTPKRPTPGWPDEASLELGLDLVSEEVAELLEAIECRRFVETVDAIGDSIVTLIGLARRLGVDLHPIMAEIQRTNMAKLTGPVREDGKRLKPPGWTPPDIAGLLRAQGLEGDGNGR